MNRRCAELSVQSGYTHYVVIDRHDSEDRLSRVVAGNCSDCGGRAIVESHPIAKATIRMSKDEPPPGAHDAREELRSLGSR